MNARERAKTEVLARFWLAFVFVLISLGMVWVTGSNIPYLMTGFCLAKMIIAARDLNKMED